MQTQDSEVVGWAWAWCVQTDKTFSGQFTSVQYEAGYKSTKGLNPAEEDEDTESERGGGGETEKERRQTETTGFALTRVPPPFDLIKGNDTAMKEIYDKSVDNLPIHIDLFLLLSYELPTRG